MYGLWYGSDGHLRLPRCRRAGSAAFSNGLKTSSDPIINGGHMLHPTLMWFCKTKQKSTASRPACTRTSGNTQQYTNTSTVQYIHNQQIPNSIHNQPRELREGERTKRGRGEVPGARTQTSWRTGDGRRRFEEIGGERPMPAGSTVDGPRAAGSTATNAVVRSRNFILLLFVGVQRRASPLHLRARGGGTGSRGGRG